MWMKDVWFFLLLKKIFGHFLVDYMKQDMLLSIKIWPYKVIEENWKLEMELEMRIDSICCPY